MSNTIPSPEQVEAMSGPELVAAYNNLHPENSVRRFASRAAGVRRVLVSLEAARTAEELSEPEVPAIEGQAPKVSKKRHAALVIPAARDGKPPRPGSKREAFLQLLLRAGGVTSAEAQEQFGWTERDVADAARLCAKKHGVPVERDADGNAWRAS